MVATMQAPRQVRGGGPATMRLSIDWRRRAHLPHHGKAQPDLTPRRLKTIAAGQKPVKEAWIRFTPAKAASHSQYGLKRWRARG